MHREASLLAGSGQPEALRLAGSGHPEAPRSRGADDSVHWRPPSRRVFVFVGQGGQWPGMARDLWGAAAFTRRYAEAAAAVLAAGGPDVRSALLTADAEALSRLAFAQPVLYALQLALVDHLAGLGVEPDAVVGHSLGEVVAAVVAGALTVEDGARIVVARCRALATIEGQGGMTAVAADPDALDLAGGPLRVAVVNDDVSCVLAGPVDALEAVETRLRAAGVWARRLSVRHASHSAHSEHAVAALATELTDLRPGTCRVPMVSTTTGGWVVGPELGAAHWARNEAEMVAFRDALTTLLAAGHTGFVEVSPHPSLTMSIERALARAGVADGAVAGALRRGVAAATSLGAITRSEPPPAVEPGSPPSLSALVGRALGRTPDPHPPLGGQGLDSIRALELQEALRAAFGVLLPLGWLASASVIDLRAAIADRPAVAPARLAPAEHARFRAFSLTDLQSAYVLGREPGFDLGEVPAALVVESEQPELDVIRLRDALRAVVARHDALHTQVDLDGQRCLAMVDPQDVVVLDVDDEGLAEARRPAPGPTALDARVLRHRGRTLLQLRFDLLAFDGRSIEVVTSELGALYADPNAALPPLPVRYRDAVVAAAVDPRDEAYWKGRELPAGPVLPRRTRTDGGPPRFVRRVGTLPPAAWDAFVARARARGVSPAVALATAYAEVVATWSASARFALNVMVLRRPAELAGVVGNFASTTLLEVDLRARAGFAERAAAVQRQLWSDLDHASFSGVRVLRELARAGGDRAYAPVVFACGFDRDAAPEGPAGPFPWHGPALTHSALQTPQVLLDHQVFRERDGSLTYQWDAAEDELRAGVVAEMFAAFGARVRELADDAAAWVSWRCLTPDRALALVTAANATRRPLPTESLHGPVFAAAARAPHAPAIVTPSRALTFGEVAGIAAACARAVGEGGGVVAIVAHKGWEEVCAALGALLAGAAYVPVDAGLPAKRVQQLLELSGASIALVQPGVELPPTAVAALPIPTDPVPVPDVPAPDLDALAYVIFTSGSTGQPKGVEITHRAARNTVDDLDERLAVGAGDAVLGVSSLSFDLSVYDVFGVLGRGGRLVLPAADRRQDPDHWLALLLEHGVTLWNSAPALMTMLAAHLGSVRGAHLPALRAALLSGDWIPVRLPAEIGGFAPTCRVVSLGGATEASIWSCVHEVVHVEPDAPSIPYGRALANQEMVVLDEWLAPRPVHAPGQIFLGGVGLARGYRGDPDKTAAAFQVHPDGARRYRTGDWGRLREDGEIEFLGRQDAQVKIRGYRVELGEIEAALTRHAGVEQARVGVVGEGRAKALAAQVVPRVPADPSLADGLRDHLREHLPAHMVPAHIQVVPALKLGPNGKVDLRIGVPDASPEAAAPSALPPELLAAWSEVMPSLPPLADREFFEIGGDSVLAVQLLANLARRTGRAVPLAAFLQRPTLGHLATLLDAGSSAAPDHLSRWDTAAGAPVDGPPLVLVHPIGGQVACYAPLVRALPRRRVLALSALERVSVGATVPDLARAYLTALAAAGEPAPRLLGGWSFGGVVAHEMARQLEARGDLVDQVVLWDAPAPAPAVPPQVRFPAFLADLARARGRPLRVDPTLPRPAQLAAARAVLGPIPDADLQAWFTVYDAHQGALDRHCPGVVQAPALVVEATGEPGRRSWRRFLAGPVCTLGLPTDHHGVLSPEHLGPVLSVLHRDPGAQR